MMYTLADYDSPADSPFRCQLVTELVPAVLTLCRNLEKSPALITLFHQCIEYYAFVDLPRAHDLGESSLEMDSRWNKLYRIMDQVGKVLKWRVCPFFNDALSNTIEGLFDKLNMAVQNRDNYSCTELGIIAVMIFLRCIISYQRKFILPDQRNAGEKAMLKLVEIFKPCTTAAVVSNAPIITSISPCVLATGDVNMLVTYFLFATKTWELINAEGEIRLKKAFFKTLAAMKCMNYENWSTFCRFKFDYLTYAGKNLPSETSASLPRIELASLLCSSGHYQVPAALAIRLIIDLTTKSTPALDGDIVMCDNYVTGTSARISNSSIEIMKKANNFSFYKSMFQDLLDDDTQPERRVHFISENKSEIVEYALSVLIFCLHKCMEARIASEKDADRCMGHLLTVLQLKVHKKAPVRLILRILEIIQQKASFKYSPLFQEFVIEPDILEQFMAMINNQDNPVTLDLFGDDGSIATVSRS